MSVEPWLNVDFYCRPTPSDGWQSARQKADEEAYAATYQRDLAALSEGFCPRHPKLLEVVDVPLLPEGPRVPEGGPALRCEACGGWWQLILSLGQYAWFMPTTRPASPGFWPFD